MRISVRKIVPYCALSKRLNAKLSWRRSSEHLIGSVLDWERSATLRVGSSKTGSNAILLPYCGDSHVPQTLQCYKICHQHSLFEMLSISSCGFISITNWNSERSYFGQLSWSFYNPLILVLLSKPVSYVVPKTVIPCFALLHRTKSQKGS